MGRGVCSNRNVWEGEFVLVDVHARFPVRQARFCFYLNDLVSNKVMSLIRVILIKYFTYSNHPYIYFS